MTPDMKLAFIDFGMMADVNEEDRYGLVGLVIGLQNKDLPSNNRESTQGNSRFVNLVEVALQNLCLSLLSFARI
jgi:hypothetical protein